MRRRFAGSSLAQPQITSQHQTTMWRTLEGGGASLAGVLAPVLRRAHKGKMVGETMLTT
jgi:hypothetical protein